MEWISGYYNYTIELALYENLVNRNHEEFINTLRYANRLEYLNNVHYVMENVLKQMTKGITLDC